MPAPGAQPVVLVLQHVEARHHARTSKPRTGAQLFRRLAASADVILETFRPGLPGVARARITSLLREGNPGLIHVRADPVRPDRPVARLSLQRSAAHGGRRRDGVVRLRRGGRARTRRRSRPAAATPGTWAATSPASRSWPRWCTARVTGEGQYIDASIHEACALTTEAAIANYIYRGEVLQRHTGRHHAAGPTPRTQFRAKDGTYVCALVGGRLNPRYIGELADLLDSYGMAGDLKDPKYQDPAVIAANTSHIIDDLVANFIASLPAEEVYHAAQQRGFTWGAVRAGRGAARRPASARPRLLEDCRAPGTRPQLHLSRRGRDLQRLALAHLPARAADRRAQRRDLLRGIGPVARRADRPGGKPRDLRHERLGRPVRDRRRYRRHFHRCRLPRCRPAICGC